MPCIQGPKRPFMHPDASFLQILAPNNFGETMLKKGFRDADKDVSVYTSSDAHRPNRLKFRTTEGKNFVILTGWGPTGARPPEHIFRRETVTKKPISITTMQTAPRADKLETHREHVRLRHLAHWLSLGQIGLWFSLVWQTHPKNGQNRDRKFATKQLSALRKKNLDIEFFSSQTKHLI